MRFHTVRSPEDLTALVEEIGFLPFFANPVAGWSLEENIDPSLWFTDQSGPWEWKGALAREKKLVYGKFIRGKAAFVSLPCFSRLCNYRRDGYDFEGRCDDNLVPYTDKLVMACAQNAGPIRRRDLRKRCGVAKGFDTVMCRLQMQTFLIDTDFVYDVDRFGRPYGWGNALIDTPERFLGAEIVDTEDCSPAQSLTAMVHRLCCAMPDVDEMRLRALLR